MKEPRGFWRVTLNAQETKTVDLALGPEELAFLNREMRRVFSPEHLKLWLVTETELIVVEK